MKMNLWKSEIDQAQNIQQIIELYNNLPNDNTLKNSSIIKWISLCQTAKEAKEVYAHTSNNSDERKTVLTKWNELSLKEIEKAKTLEETKEAYNNTPENSQARKVASEKLSELQ
jgi:hypoxanthine phosphoribosyltransferase